MASRGFPPEERFLREALLALGTGRPGLADAAAQVRDWSRLVDRARAGSVAESVWAGLVLRGAEDRVPGPERECLQEAHEEATARNALLLTEAVRMQGALADAGIESVVLKGPGLLLACYPDIGARHVGDVDILVRERDARRAEEALLRAGAQVPAPLVRYDGVARAVGETVGQGEIGFRTDRGVQVELHDRIPGGARDGSDVDEILGRSRTVTWQAGSFRVPSVEDTAAGLCVHVFDHHEGEEKFLLRHLADLAVLVGTGRVGWEVVEARAGTSGRSAVAFSRELLDTGAPGGALLVGHALSRRARHWRNVLTGRGPVPSSALRVLFPSRAYMATRYRVAPDAAVMPLLYAWRPFRGFWTVLTGK